MAKKATAADEVAAVSDLLDTSDGRRIVVDADDMTLDALDRADKLRRSGGAGKVTAMTYAYLHELDPRVTLAQVRALKLGQIDFRAPSHTAPPADPDDVEGDDLGDEDDPDADTVGPDFLGGQPSRVTGELALPN